MVIKNEKFLGPVSVLTHWGQNTHICIGKLTIIASDNGLSPGWHKAIIWTSAGILLIAPLGTNFNEISIEIHTFSLKKMHLKMSSAKWLPFCHSLSELKLKMSGHASQKIVQSIISSHCLCHDKASCTAHNMLKKYSLLSWCHHEIQIYVCVSWNKWFNHAVYTNSHTYPSTICIYMIPWFPKCSKYIIVFQQKDPTLSCKNGHQYNLLPEATFWCRSILQRL